MGNQKACKEAMLTHLKNIHVVKCNYLTLIPASGGKMTPQTTFASVSPKL